MSETPDLNYKEQFDNNHHTDRNNIPTLYSQSPPPIQENSDDDDEDDEQKQSSFDLNAHHLSNSIASSSSSSPKLTMPSPPHRESSPRPPTHKEQNLNSLQDFDKEWTNDFTPFNSNDNQDDVDSGWANFEPSVSSNNNVNFKNDFPSDIINQSNKLADTKEISNPSETTNNDDDEWGNFVEIEQVSIPNNQNNHNANKLSDANTDFSQEQQEEIILEKNLKSETVATNLIDYDLILNDLFNSKNVKFFNDAYNDLVVNNLVIETDDLWQEIQTFTTVTDASNSLQFKWCLSNLEDNYLSALNLERITKTNRTLSPQSILQPVKVEPSSTRPTVINSEYKDEIKNSTDLIKPDLLSAPVLNNIDLSFFESKELVNTNNSTNNNTHNNSSKSNLKQQNSNSNSSSKPDSKVYLDKLLEEIFTNDTKKSKSLNKENSQQPQSDDLFSEKKSLSSSSISSSSSSNLNELNHSISSNNNTNSLPILQLAPHLLEMQQMKANRECDEKALNLVSKLSNVTFKNPQLVVLPR